MKSANGDDRKFVPSGLVTFKTFTWGDVHEKLCTLPQAFEFRTFGALLCGFWQLARSE
jgi:hypothetical protein